MNSRNRRHRGCRVAGAAAICILLALPVVSLAADTGERDGPVCALADRLKNQEFEEILAESRDLLRSKDLGSEEQAAVSKIRWDALLGLGRGDVAASEARIAIEGQEKIALSAIDFLVGYYFGSDEHETILDLANSSRSGALTPKVELEWGIAATRSLVHLGRVDDSVEEMRELAASYGENRELKNWAAASFWMEPYLAGNNEVAIELIGAADKYFPSLREDANFLLNKSGMFYDLGNDKLAESSYLQALTQAKSGEEYARAYFGLANATYRAKHYEKTATYLDELDKFADVELPGVDFAEQSQILRELVDAEIATSARLGCGTIFPPVCECSFASDCEGNPGPGTWSCILCQCIALNSPLVLNLGDYLQGRGSNQNWWREGFCSSEHPTVCLDWLGDGRATCSSWPAPDSDLAFLVSLSPSDRSLLGAKFSVPVEPWRHLFGNVTRGPEGKYPYKHGFAALAGFCGIDPDSTSGIDMAKCGANLHVWSDSNSDGLMDADEILPFRDLGIESLGALRRTGKEDSCGNAFPYEAHAKCSGQPGKCGIWFDVFFASR